MKTLVAVAVVALGWLVCPSPPGVDPELVLNRAMCKCKVCPTCAALLQRNYTPLVEGRDVIDGRTAWVLRLKPHRKKTPWRQLWVDVDTYAVLAQRDWSSRNEMKRTAAGLGLQQCRQGACEHEGLQSKLDPAAEALGGKLVLPGYVPRGFELLNVEVDKKGASVQVVYTDGMYGISVIEGREAETAGRELRPGRVYDWGQGMIVCRRVGGKRVLLVADLPVADMEKMAGSLR